MLKKSLQLARILSLDVVLGSIIGSLFIADFLQVQLSYHFILALAICVWLIYTADHLADAINIPHEAHSSRHRFHQKFLRPLTIIFCLVSILGLFLLSQLPLRLITWGSVVLGMVGLYFVSIRWFNLQYVFHKEIVVAFLYSIGIFLAPVYLNSFPAGIEIWILFVEYVLIALSNLILFSWYEKEFDEKDRQVSFVTVVGKEKSKRTLIICLSLLYGVIVLATALYYPDIKFLGTQSIILSMTITLHGILLFPIYFQQHERYRSVADAIFLYPILYLLL